MKRLFVSLIVCLGISFNLYAEEVDKDGFVKISDTLFLKSFTAETPAPTIIHIHGAGGARRGPEIPTRRQWVKTIKSWGYNVVIVDLFTARGFHESLATRGEVVSFKDRAKDIIAAVEYIKSKEWHKGDIGLIGFSQGGATIFATSDLPTDTIKAGVAFYPACGYVHPVSKPTFKIQMHIGLNDDMSLPHLCNLPFWAQKEKYNVNEYENTTHAFDINRPPAVLMGKFHFRYNEESLLKAQSKTREFFDANLK